MNIKYIKRLVPAACLMLSMGFSSCIDSLDVTPIDPSTNMEKDDDALFIKCYANMAVAGNGGANGDCDIDGLDGGTTGFVRQMFNANELTSDEAICGWGDEGIPAFNFNQWGASHPMLRGFYYRLYFGVTMCNFYLQECSAHDAQMTAEVRFLRALYYFHLMDCWGNVPYIVEMSDKLSSQYSRAEMFDFIESELLDCVNGMAEPRKAQYGRADKAAAWMLLARLYLNAEVYTGTAQWSKAEEYAKKVMTSGYKLNKEGKNGWSAYQMLFMGDNGETSARDEAILALLQDGKETTSWGTTLFLMASTFKADMVTYNGEQNGTTENWAGNRCRPDLLAKFFPNGDAPAVTSMEMVQKAGDDRAIFWGQDRTLQVENASEFTSGYSCAKFVNFYATGGNRHDTQFPDADFFLMRTAEAYLTFAEARIRETGNTQDKEALDAINEVRNRAHASSLNACPLQTLCDEWSREFYFEGRRRSDLIRFGYFGGNNDYKWQWKGGAMAGTTFSKDLNIFAIPDKDLNVNPNLKQNPGY